MTKIEPALHEYFKTGMQNTTIYLFDYVEITVSANVHADIFKALLCGSGTEEQYLISNFDVASNACGQR